jgi:hypothetical protein
MHIGKMNQHQQQHTQISYCEETLRQELRSYAHLKDESAPATTCTNKMHRLATVSKPYYKNCVHMHISKMNQHQQQHAQIR